MGTHSVQLDNEAEKALSDIVNYTGTSISDAIKQSLKEYRKKTLVTTKQRPADFFKEFDLGDDDCAIGAARDSKRLVKEKLLAR